MTTAWTSTQSMPQRWRRGIITIVVIASGWPVVVFPSWSALVWCVIGTGLAIGITHLFAHMRVTVDNTAVIVKFTTGWPGRRVALDDIVRTSVVTMSAVHGWGIRAVPGGWLWRAGGRRAVRLDRVSGRALIIGNDEPEALVAAINSRRDGAPSAV
ncbi:MAG: hypothetical protein O3A28_09065 [Actinomycetota bacterium]|nr:hypothetical protein [Actinomycetota bacterium]MDA3007880.1 hypothetical protein [Actinomycetota bacterium]MDA3035161.1 hypothetical protein [Actinomycetota bacterium]